MKCYVRYFSPDLLQQEEGDERDGDEQLRRQDGVHLADEGHADAAVGEGRPCPLQPSLATPCCGHVRQRFVLVTLRC